MQQKLCSRGSGSFLLERNGQACGAVATSVTSCDLPFRCPRCGEQERFRSLASLRAHLEYRHSYRPPEATAGSFSITGKFPDPPATAAPWHDTGLPTRRGQQSTRRVPHSRSLSDSRDGGFLQSYSSVRRRTQSVGVGTQAEEGEEEQEDEEEEGGTEDENVGEGDEEEDNDEERDGGRNEEDIKMGTKRLDAGHRHLNHHHLLFPRLGPLGPPLDPDLELDPDPDPDPDLDLDLVGAFGFEYFDKLHLTAQGLICRCVFSVSSRNLPR